MQSLSTLKGKWPARLFLAAPDPSPHPQVPGWPFRNYLALLATMFPGEVVQLAALRAAQGTFDAACSYFFVVQLPAADAGWLGESCPRIAGWEKGQVGSFTLR